MDVTQTLLPRTKGPTVRVWGVPLAPLTLEQTLEQVEQLIQAGAPQLVITANLHYAMLSAGDPAVQRVNEDAALVLADGMPLVWASGWREQVLPERVAGSDLLPALCEQAAQRGHRVFLLGGAPGVAEQAATRLTARFPGLQVAGIETPPFRPLTDAEEGALVGRIRASHADILFAALGQPRGELWLSRWAQELGVPVCIQVGASLDFAAGRIRRAPRWIQRLGVEWLYRLYLEPRRLGGRYFCNARFLLGRLRGDLWRALRQGSCRERNSSGAEE